MEERGKTRRELGDYIDRIGIDEFMSKLGVPRTRHNRCEEASWNFGVRQFITYM